jgi:hypothetical protein
MGTERRRQPRFKPGDLKFAGFDSSGAFVGKIRNICLEGISGEYILKELAGEERLTVYLWDSEGFYLQDLTCKIVYENVSQASRPPFYGPSVRVAGFQFENLAAHQKAKIQRFIQEQDSPGPGPDPANQSGRGD